MTTIHRLALKLAFGAAVFGVIAWLVDLTETFQVLRGVNSTWLLLAVLCYISKRVLMAIKWWILLGSRTASISYATVQRAMLLSDCHGLLFPNTLALGALHAVFLRHQPRGLTFMAASILADRVINLATAARLAFLALAATLPLTKATVAPRVYEHACGDRHPFADPERSASRLDLNE